MLATTPRSWGDQQHGHAEAGLQVLQQLEDLRLDGDVERGGRLVRDDQRRAADQRHRDHRALAQTAREFEREGAHRLARIGKADARQHVFDALRDFGRRQRAMERQRLADLIADRVQRRQRRHRFLEHDRDARGPELAHPLAARVERGDVEHAVLSLRIGEEDAALRDASRLGQDAEDRLADDRLARTGLADDGDRRARTDAETHAVDRAHERVVDAELDRDVLDFEQVLTHRRQCRDGRD